ncbi:hypothetical protein HN51_018680 [Arachis hypogaea]|uniref:RRM domain-containing protein n=1 Tax=Arachis hypogaea TaxID=3818 RepID=A0A445BU71_ARAHY|nr:RNA-binding protein 1 isoform X1 [Arachis hypogaea]QHO30309.1 RNA-binding protein [Arachis hypogaea]RYR42259.1 hypothetical protein Ahy_A08g038727 [Arachis hypogaea]
MADPYYPYIPDGGISRTTFPGYIPAEPPALASPLLSNSTALRAAASDYMQSDVSFLRMSAYGVDDALLASAVRSESVSMAPTGLDMKAAYSALEDPTDLGKTRDASLPVNPVVSNDALSNSLPESNVLFVGGLPKDCTRREVGHLFRPFIGYKDIRVVHKEPRRSGDKALTLCFVEFVDSKCALTAMEALQGYKFDDKKPESPTLKIQFAHFPFSLPHDHGE